MLDGVRKCGIKMAIPNLPSVARWDDSVGRTGEYLVAGIDASRFSKAIGERASFIFHRVQPRTEITAFGKKVRRYRVPIIAPLTVRKKKNYTNAKGRRVIDEVGGSEWEGKIIFAVLRQVISVTVISFLAVKRKTESLSCLCRLY